MSRADEWLSSLRRTLTPSQHGNTPLYAPNDLPLPAVTVPLVREVRRYETAPAAWPSVALVQQVPQGVYDTITVTWTRPEAYTTSGAIRVYPRVCVRLWEGRYRGIAEGMYEDGELDPTTFVTTARQYRLVHVAPPQQQEQLGACFGGTIVVPVAPTMIPFFVSLSADGDEQWDVGIVATLTTMAITVITERLRGNV